MSEERNFLAIDGAFQRGRDDFYNMLDQNDNPYPFNTEDYEDWRLGWIYSHGNAWEKANRP